MMQPNQIPAPIPSENTQTSGLPTMSYTTSYVPVQGQTFSTGGSSGLMQFSTQPQTSQIPQQFFTQTQAPAPQQFFAQASLQKQYPPIVLHEYQKPHYEKLSQTLRRSFFAIDASVMGSGKTLVGMKLALDNNLPVIVVAPPSVKNVWYEHLNRYGIPYKLFHEGPVMSYNALSGTAEYQPSHGFLTRYERQMGESVKSKKETVFQPTPLLDRYINEGILFIFDEAHNLKNSTSDRHKAALAIIRRIYALGGNSRFLLISGTPLDKQEQVKNFLKLVGFVQHRQAYMITAGQVVMKGLDELNQWALRLNPEQAKIFMATRMNPPPRTKGAADKYQIDMFLQVLKPVLMSVMIPPENSVSNKDIKNGFYEIDAESRPAYENAIRGVIQAVQFNPVTGVSLTPVISDNINNLIRLTQIAKAKTMARVARWYLSTPDEYGHWRKLLLYSAYSDAIKIMMNELRDFNPLELTGQIPQNRRPGIVAQFQVPSMEHRVLIANPEVGGIGISLHDLSGLYPRWLLMMADYHAIRNLQTAARIIRDGMKGTGHVRFFYIKSALPEQALLRSLESKGAFMSDLLSEQKEGGQLFANDYETETEGVDIPDLVPESDPGGESEKSDENDDE